MKKAESRSADTPLPAQQAARASHTPFIDWLAAFAAQVPAPFQLRYIGRGDPIYRRGDPARLLYVVREGCIAVVHSDHEGRAYVTSVFGQGDVFGETCLCGLPDCLETAVALRSATLLCIPGALLQACPDQGEMQAALLAHLAIRLAEQRAVAGELLSANSEQRLARILVRIGHSLGERVDTHLLRTPGLTQGELSRMVGTTRSRIGLFLKRFREKGLIRPHGDSAFLIDTQALLQHAEGCGDAASEPGLREPDTTVAAPVARVDSFREIHDALPASRLKTR